MKYAKQDLSKYQMNHGEEPSHYILADEDFSLEEAERLLEESVNEDLYYRLKFIEFDRAVAQAYGWKYYAIFHEII